MKIQLVLYIHTMWLVLVTFLCIPLNNTFPPIVVEAKLNIIITKFYLNETSKIHFKLITCEVKNQLLSVVVDIFKEIKNLFV